VLVAVLQFDADLGDRRVVLGGHRDDEDFQLLIGAQQAQPNHRAGLLLIQNGPDLGSALHHRPVDGADEITDLDLAVGGPGTGYLGDLGQRLDGDARGHQRSHRRITLRIGHEFVLVALLLIGGQSRRVDLLTRQHRFVRHHIGQECLRQRHLGIRLRHRDGGQQQFAGRRVAVRTTDLQHRVVTIAAQQIDRRARRPAHERHRDKRDRDDEHDEQGCGDDGRPALFGHRPALPLQIGMS